MYSKNVYLQGGGDRGAQPKQMAEFGNNLKVNTLTQTSNYHQQHTTRSLLQVSGIHTPPGPSKMTDRYGHPRQSIFPPNARRHASATASVAYSTSHHLQAPQPPAPAAAQPAKTPAARHIRFQTTTAAAVRRSHLAPARRGLDGCGAVDAAGDDDAMVVDDYDEEDGENDGDGGSGSGSGEGDDDGGIVVRNANGEYEVEELPSMVVDDPDEEVLDMRQENESKCWYEVALELLGI